MELKNQVEFEDRVQTGSTKYMKTGILTELNYKNWCYNSGNEYSRTNSKRSLLGYSAL